MLSTGLLSFTIEGAPAQVLAPPPLTPEELLTSDAELLGCDRQLIE